MKRAITVFCIIGACIVPKERCFADLRTKTIDEVTYTYGIEGSNDKVEVPKRSISQAKRKKSPFLLQLMGCRLWRLALLVLRSAVG